MPACEYVCGKCGTKTEVLATMAAKEAGLKPSSPICGNKKMLPPFGGHRVAVPGMDLVAVDEG
ncbi:MAG: hypothetical protein ABFD66_08345 [Smithella sp.]